MAGEEYVAAAALEITAVSPADGVVGVPYSQTLNAFYGAPPYTWSITSGTLPPGLSLGYSGVISGTPSAPGISTFTIMATDSEGNSAAISLSITTTAQPSPTATAKATPEKNGGSNGWIWFSISLVLLLGMAIITGTAFKRRRQKKLGAHNKG
jgi:hypothetical protein